MAVAIAGRTKVNVPCVNSRVNDSSKLEELLKRQSALLQLLAVLCSAMPNLHSLGKVLLPLLFGQNRYHFLYLLILRWNSHHVVFRAACFAA